MSTSKLIKEPEFRDWDHNDFRPWLTEYFWRGIDVQRESAGASSSRLWRWALRYFHNQRQPPVSLLFGVNTVLFGDFFIFILEYFDLSPHVLLKLNFYLKQMSDMELQIFCQIYQKIGKILLFQYLVWHKSTSNEKILKGVELVVI